MIGETVRLMEDHRASEVRIAHEIDLDATVATTLPSPGYVPEEEGLGEEALRDLSVVEGNRLRYQYERTFWLSSLRYSAR